MKNAAGQRPDKNSFLIRVFSDVTLQPFLHFFQGPALAGADCVVIDPQDQADLPAGIARKEVEG